MGKGCKDVLPTTGQQTSRRMFYPMGRSRGCLDQVPESGQNRQDQVPGRRKLNVPRIGAPCLDTAIQNH